MKYCIKVERIDSLKPILKYYFDFCEKNVTSITLDLEKCLFLRSNFCAVFGAILRAEVIKGKDVFLKGPSHKKIEVILCKNNFLPLIKSDAYCKIHDNYGTVIEYNRMNIGDSIALEKFMDYFSYDLLVERGLNNLSKSLLKKIIQKIYELFINSFIHSNSLTPIYSAGQFFPKEDKMYFTIVDMGVGIKYNVNKYNQTNYNSCEAIEWALKESNSTTGEGGLGLSLLEELIIQGNGKLEIISDDGFYQIKNKIVKQELLSKKFEGTIINIVFDTDKNKYFQ